MRTDESGVRAGFSRMAESSVSEILNPDPDERSWVAATSSVVLVPSWVFYVRVGMDRTTRLFAKVQMFVLLEVDPRFGKSADFYKQTSDIDKRMIESPHFSHLCKTGSCFRRTKQNRGEKCGPEHLHTY